MLDWPVFLVVLVGSLIYPQQFCELFLCKTGVVWIAANADAGRLNTGRQHQIEPFLGILVHKDNLGWIFLRVTARFVLAFKYDLS